MSQRLSILPRNRKFNITADLGNHNYNYYGIYALQPASDIDLKQSYNELKINGYYDFFRIIGLMMFDLNLRY
jgi:hypothetical protein